MKLKSFKPTDHQTEKPTNQGRHERNAFSQKTYKLRVQKLSALAGVEGNSPKKPNGGAAQDSDLPRKGSLQMFAEKWRLRTKRDECGETIIPGKRGHIFEHGENSFGLLFASSRPRLWAYAKKKLAAAGFSIRQDGDTEGTALFDPLNPEQVRLAVKVTAIKSKRIASPAQLEAIRKASLVRQAHRNQRAEGCLAGQNQWTPPA